MNKYRPTADASYIYRECTSADFASMKSSAQYGNVADLIRNNIVVLPQKTLPVIAIIESDKLSSQPS
jgi:hypothetical protein